MRRPGGPLYRAAVVVYVVRHAWAGNKQEWSGPDDARPLDAFGAVQADALGDAFSPRAVRQILSSPSERCVATVAPLAERTGRPVRATAMLAVGGATSQLRNLLVHPSADGSVLCTHGEVMRPLLSWLHDLDVLIDADDPGDEHLLSKGTGWAVELTRGRRPTLRHVAPMPVRCPTTT